MALPSDDAVPFIGSADHMKYEIRVKDGIDQMWSEWFDGMVISEESKGVTIISGDLEDQAALHGVLSKIRDLGLPLISLAQVPPDETPVP